MLVSGLIQASHQTLPNAIDHAAVFAALGLSEQTHRASSRPPISSSAGLAGLVPWLAVGNDPSITAISFDMKNPRRISPRGRYELSMMP
ncbi:MULTISPECIES: hypothetical protein [unclassified Bradyrhizobium]|jgi:hypothetical protein